MITYTTDRKVEIIGPYKHIHIRDIEVVLDDGVEIGRKPPHRSVIGPLDTAPCEECQCLKDLYHTPALVLEYATMRATEALARAQAAFDADPSEANTQALADAQAYLDSL
jgi:hypothetical protein